DASLESILQALEQNRRRRAVVIDVDKRVVGIITDGDLVRRSQAASHPGLLARLRGLVTGQPTAVHLPEGTETAVSLMTTPVITITTETPLITALQLMIQHEVKRLPVVDANGRLVGLLGRGSLLRGLLLLE
ncbi:MAG: CBS domain-containing protein, partial [Anaerolineales bacterium]|nr:CBS domain-containing protein [Anaerolineales bacterium]